MIAIVWEFIVRDEAVPAFQRAYGPNGEWAILFRQYPGYEGTTLLQDTTARGRFLTIDRWENESLFEQMHHSSQYSRLDAMFGELTVSERRVGVFLLL
jgi:heme-degrading monooxygenase HmoA